MNPNPMSRVTSHQTDDEQGMDNTDTEEVAIKQLTDYVGSHDLPNEGFKLKEISAEILA